MLLPVSGVVPSMVSTISNVSVSRSIGDTSQSGEFSSILTKRSSRAVGRFSMKIGKNVQGGGGMKVDKGPVR